MTQIVRKWGARIVQGVLLALFGYGAAGMVGGAIPANRNWREPTRGITVYVASNGVHVDLIVPKVAARVDWRPIARPGDLGDPRFANYDYLGIGIGEHAFYLETPTWAEVRPATLIFAAIGSDRTLLHFDHLPRPEPADDIRAVVLTPAQYRRLSAYILASLKPGGLHYPGYGPYDAFYEARGHYDALATCNAWAGDALRFAGVRVGRWTPFPVTVLGWFPLQERNDDPAYR